MRSGGSRTNWRGPGRGPKPTVARATLTAVPSREQGSRSERGGEALGEQSQDHEKESGSFKAHALRGHLVRHAVEPLDVLCNRCPQSAGLRQPVGLTRPSRAC